jgi:hypothetical protein
MYTLSFLKKKDDVYRDARAPSPVLTPGQWLEGQNLEPSKESLQPVSGGLPPISSKPPETKRQSSAQVMRQEIKVRR